MSKVPCLLRGSGLFPHPLKIKKASSVKNKYELLRPKGLHKLWFLFLMDDISASLAEVKTKSTGNLLSESSVSGEVKSGYSKLFGEKSSASIFRFRINWRKCNIVSRMLCLSSSVGLACSTNHFMKKSSIMELSLIHI